MVEQGKAGAGGGKAVSGSRVREAGGCEEAGDCGAYGFGGGGGGEDYAGAAGGV